MENTINIRAIQHYMYCPRRFALLEVNNDWQENAFVVKANLIHENVHSGKHDYSNKSKIVKSNVSVYNDLSEYNLYGVLDCIELIKDKSGVYVQTLDDYFKINIVEYKPRPPKDKSFHESDAIQVFAQKISIDYIFNCNCQCFIYYSESRKRILLPFETEYTEYDLLLKKYISAMRDILENRKIPKRNMGQKCSGCSLVDKCFPKVNKFNVKQEILMQSSLD